MAKRMRDLQTLWQAFRPLAWIPASLVCLFAVVKITDVVLGLLLMTTRGWAILSETLLLGVLAGLLWRRSPGRFDQRHALRITGIAGWLLWLYAYNRLGFVGRAVDSMPSMIFCAYIVLSGLFHLWRSGSVIPPQNGENGIFHLVIGITGIIALMTTTDLPLSTRAFVLCVALINIGVSVMYRNWFTGKVERVATVPDGKGSCD